MNGSLQILFNTLMMRHFSTRTRIFLALSLLLAVSDALFVLINYRAEQARFHTHIEQRAENLRNLFAMEVANTSLRMQQIATFIAAMPEVQQAFSLGRQTVEAEGGGLGGEKSRQARAHLLALVNDPWQKMRQLYDTRQLHFQIGEQATSFLRVHATEKFGDSLDDVRHTIMDAIREQKHTGGFECGRIICGIRGVSPVNNLPDTAANPSFIGVLEAGTSFHNTLDLIEKSGGASIAVLLAKSHLEETYFPDRLAMIPPDDFLSDGHFIEATLHPEIRSYLADERIAQLVRDKKSDWFQMNGKALAFTAFELRDYLGLIQAERPAVGTVVAWLPVDAEVSDLYHDLKVNIGYAIIAYLLIEGLLFLALQKAVEGLEGVIARQTRSLKDLAAHDALTGLYNRHYLDEFVARVYASSDRQRAPCSLAIMDIDYFKQVNDTYGHLRGDQVLQACAALVKARLRASDIAFRYGGEEFLLVFPATEIDKAQQICETLRTQLIGKSLGGLVIGKLTASFGVACRSATNETLERTLARADRALYEAKRLGRNRVEITMDNCAEAASDT
ncbi:MAG: diguanylate cyclase [Gammaproteobacteria bacterium]|nr:diguanylate cyclase [Gammaproteobacteria bacterium]